MRSTREVRFAKFRVELFHEPEMGAVILRDRGEGFLFRVDLNRDLLKRTWLPKIIHVKAKVLPRF